MTINKSFDEIKTCLKYYIPNKYWDLNDWSTIIERVEEVEEGIYQFRCSFYTLYFDENMRPVTYGNLIVCESRNNNVYYDFQKYKEYSTEPPIPIGDYDWENATDWGNM